MICERFSRAKNRWIQKLHQQSLKISDQFQIQISGHFRQISTHLITKSAKQTKSRVGLDRRANLVNSRDKIYPNVLLSGHQLTNLIYLFILKCVNKDRLLLLTVSFRLCTEELAKAFKRQVPVCLHVLESQHS